MTLALSEKASRTALEQMKQQWPLQLKNELARHEVLIGTITRFAMTIPPFGCRIADESVVFQTCLP